MRVFACAHKHNHCRYTHTHSHILSRASIGFTFAHLVIVGFVKHFFKSRWYIFLQFWHTIYIIISTLHQGFHLISFWFCYKWSRLQKPQRGTKKVYKKWCCHQNICALVDHMIFLCLLEVRIALRTTRKNRFISIFKVVDYKTFSIRLTTYLVLKLLWLFACKEDKTHLT